MATISQGSLKQLGLAALQFVQNQEGRLTLQTDNYVGLLKPFVGNEQVFYVPLAEPKKMYSFNDFLTGTNFHDIKEPTQTVMFYAGQNGKLDFLYQDRAAIAFADGHVKLVTREEAKALRWKP